MPDDDRREPVVFRARAASIRRATRSTASASLVDGDRLSGRASVRDASLIASPTRRAPTSTREDPSVIIQML